MKEFLINNWTTIAIVAGFVGFILYHIITKKWSDLREHAYKFMLVVEKAIAQSHEGQRKFEIVFDKVYSLIPPWLRLFITPDDLKRKLQKWYDMMKDELKPKETSVQ